MNQLKSPRLKRYRTEVFAVEETTSSAFPFYFVQKCKIPSFVWGPQSDGKAGVDHFSFIAEQLIQVWIGSLLHTFENVWG